MMLELQLARAMPDSETTTSDWKSRNKRLSQMVSLKPKSAATSIAQRRRAAKGDVSAREVNEKTGVSLGAIVLTPSWRALQTRLEAKGKSKRSQKKSALSADAMVKDLVAEQYADNEGSSLGKGRRAKNRIRQQI